MYIHLSKNLHWLSPVVLSPGNIINGSYDYNLVALSFLIAVLGSYVALDMIGNLRAEKNFRAKILWIISGALVMGTAIWSMHFVGMLAFVMPMVMTYDPFWTVLSLMAAIIGSGIAFVMLQTEQRSKVYFFLSSVLMGFAIATMHYLGMEAMEGKELIEIVYIPSLFFLSIFIAILASMAALFLAVKSSQKDAKTNFKLKGLSAILMGIAICGMHYTGMAAAIFTSPHIMVEPGDTIGRDLIGLCIASGMSLIMIVSLIISAQRQLRLNELARERRLAFIRDIEVAQDQMHQKMIAIAHLAAGAAHEINNPLSYILSNLGVLQKRFNLLAQLQDLYLALILEIKQASVNQLDSTVKKIDDFYQEKKIANLLADTNDMMNESKEGLLRIKDIVANLRNFAGAKEELQPGINVNKIIEESIDTVFDKLKIKSIIQKNLNELPNIVGSSNQLKVLFTNLLLNADEAIVQNGIIKITSLATASEIQIQISDNGRGISAENLPNIFNPFYTTKPIGSGTGLGLATVFGIAKLHGGKVSVESEIGKGSIFTVHLPLKGGE